MRKSTQIIRICLCLWIIAFCIPTRVAHAASVTMTFSTEEETFCVGDKIEVTLTLYSNDVMGDVEAYLSYDETMLEFLTAPACILGGGGLLRVSDKGASPSNGERTYKIWFTALNPGECDIAAYDRPKVYSFSNGSEMSVTSMSKTIIILPNASSSDNSQLASLRLLDGNNKEVSLIPAFSASETGYFAVVGNETQRVSVSALADDGRSAVSLSGEQNLTVGSNIVQVVVTAESGKKTVYTIYVQRLSGPLEPTKQPEKKPEKEKEPDEQKEPTSTPEIMEITGGIHLSPSEEGALLSMGQKYIVCASLEGLDLPNGYEKTSLFVDGIQATAYAKSGEETQETLLLVLKKENEEAAWYRYDRKDQTVQRISEEQFVFQTIVQSDDEGLRKQVAEYESRQDGQLLVLALLSALCVLLMIIVLVLVLFYRRRR